MCEALDSIHLLRRKVAKIEGRRMLGKGGYSSIDHADIDLALGGGLARGRMHEVFAVDPADAGSAAGFEPNFLTPHSAHSYRRMFTNIYEQLRTKMAR